MTDAKAWAGSWSPDQLGQFIDQVRNDRFFALWMLVSTTGIPTDALVDLRRGDIDLQEPRLTLRPEGGPSRGRVPLAVARTYALDPDAHEALREHVIAWDKESSGQRSDRIFVWSDGGPLHPKSVKVLFRRHCQNAQLPLVPFRGVRQAYVSAALESGIPTAVIRERLGRGQSASFRGDSGGPKRRTSTSERRQLCHLRLL